MRIATSHPRRDAYTEADAVRQIAAVLERGRADPLSQRQLNELVDAIEALMLRRYDVATVLALRATYYEIGERNRAEAGLPLRTHADVDAYFHAVRDQMQSPSGSLPVSEATKAPDDG